MNPEIIIVPVDEIPPDYAKPFMEGVNQSDGRIWLGQSDFEWYGIMAALSYADKREPKQAGYKAGIARAQAVAKQSVNN